MKSRTLRPSIVLPCRHVAGQEWLVSHHDSTIHNSENLVGPILGMVLCAFPVSKLEMRFQHFSSSKMSTEFDENASNKMMDLYSRQIGTYGVETMQKFSQLAVLVVGVKGSFPAFLSS